MLGQPVSLEWLPTDEYGDDSHQSCAQLYISASSHHFDRTAANYSSVFRRAEAIRLSYRDRIETHWYAPCVVFGVRAVHSSLTRSTAKLVRLRGRTVLRRCFGGIFGDRSRFDLYGRQRVDCRRFGDIGVCGGHGHELIGDVPIGF